MMYLLGNERGEYCLLDSNNGIKKTRDIRKATRFQDYEDAGLLLKKATNKLKGFQVVEPEEVTIPEKERPEPVKAEQKQAKKPAECRQPKRKILGQVKRDLVYSKNKGRCALCGRFVPYNAFTVDHIVPVDKGGGNELVNLQTCCEVCNQMKSSMLPEEFKEKITEIFLYQMKKDFNKEAKKALDSLYRKESVKELKEAFRKWKDIKQV